MTSLEWIQLFLKQDNEVHSSLKLIAEDSKIPESAVRLLQHHLMAPRAYRLLQEAGLEKIANESLFRCFLSSLRVHTLYQEKTKTILSLLERLGIPTIVIKGPIFAERFYTVPTDRSFSDLDLVFPYDQQNQVKNALQLAGFLPIQGQKKFSANDYKFEFYDKQNPAIIVECHFELGHGEQRFSDYWHNSLIFCNARVLSLEYEYLYLLFHGCVQHRLQKLGWLLDLAQMRHKINLDFALLQSLAKQLNLNHALFISEYWLSNFAGVGSPQITNENLDEWLARIAIGSLENSNFQKAQLRAMFAGGWMPILRYAWARNFAKSTSPAPMP